MGLPRGVLSRPGSFGSDTLAMNSYHASWNSEIRARYRKTVQAVAPEAGGLRSCFGVNGLRISNVILAGAWHKALVRVNRRTVWGNPPILDAVHWADYVVPKGAIGDK